MKDVIKIGFVLLITALWMLICLPGALVYETYNYFYDKRRKERIS